ncbi:conserved hypothetical protein [Pediculus humanus corporis]|uniref:EF-hand domain-containing protein n=1 Tax=Pediculus humanus subsp. corporis TaxID=121224 RepID=E0W0Q5_PEDHC|nr:uncharacterized protein Phum_PHUM561970 [Pediculus humanus corporis]EEB19211.1 conserved hypothetical protein [Pediculus humanus corporis]
MLNCSGNWVSKKSDPTRSQSPPVHDLTEEDEERIEKLFKTLDLDGNGKIDIHDLSVSLKESGVSPMYAKKFLERSDQNNIGHISLEDFIIYVKEHEKNLKLVFTTFDKNRDGKLDIEELTKAFKELGIEIDESEALKLVQRMDTDGSLNISYNEWRDFLFYAPSHDIQELIKYWRHSSAYLDIGEDLNVPDDFTAKEMMTGMWWRHLVAGGIAGGVSRSCTAPLDRIKVYLQVHGSFKKMSIKDCLSGMLREGGIQSLWRGNGINVLKIAPESAIKFMAYEQAKRAIRWSHTRELSMLERFAAGSIAGGISQTVIYPLEVMKTRLALRKTGEYKSIIHAAKVIYAREGLRCFYRGYVPNLLGIIPYAGIDLAVYETLKNTYISKHGGSDEQPAVALLLACGTISTICGQVCSYPLALVRTRLQAKVVTTAEDQKNCKMSTVFKTIIQKEGFMGLYRGIAPNFLKVIPAVSISYVVYERCRLLLGVDMT